MMQQFKHSVLLVDDEVIIATQIEEVLRAEGYRVVGIETSGADAITAAQRLAPDIVVMDIMMPGPIDGIAAAHKIMDVMNIPVLFLTAYADERLLTRTKPLDPFGYVLKPVQDKQLIVAIELALYKKKMEDRLLDTYQQLTVANQKLSKEIAGHQKARRALQINEAKYRTLVENIPDIVYSFDADGRVRTVNPSIKQHYRVATAEVVDRNVMAFIFPGDRHRIMRHFLKTLRKGQRFSRGDRFRIVSKEGEIHWVERNACLSFDDQGRFTHEEGVLRDITIQKQLQDQLIRTERLSASGQLAASIAHEINSPLQAASLILNTLQAKCPRDRKLNTGLQLIADAFDSIRLTVKRLIDLNRPSQAVSQLTAINSVITDTIQLTQFHLRQRDIDVTLQLAKDLPMINASPQGLSHAILSLINNASEAIANRDASATPTAPGRSPKRITISTANQSDCILISVADTGPGIPEDDLQGIFDLSFTRKKPMGIGVGLSVCNGIVRDHGGILTVANRPQGGARFTIQLPIQS